MLDHDLRDGLSGAHGRLRRLGRCVLAVEASCVFVVSVVEASCFGAIPRPLAFSAPVRVQHLAVRLGCTELLKAPIRAHDQILALSVMVCFSDPSSS